MIQCSKGFGNSQSQALSHPGGKLPKTDFKLQNGRTEQKARRVLPVAVQLPRRLSQQLLSRY